MDAIGVYISFALWAWHWFLGNSSSPMGARGFELHVYNIGHTCCVFWERSELRVWCGLGGGGQNGCFCLLAIVNPIDFFAHVHRLPIVRGDCCFHAVL